MGMVMADCFWPCQCPDIPFETSTYRIMVEACKFCRSDGNVTFGNLRSVMLPTKSAILRMMGSFEMLNIDLKRN